MTLIFHLERTKVCLIGPNLTQKMELKETRLRIKLSFTIIVKNRDGDFQAQAKVKPGPFAKQTSLGI